MTKTTKPQKARPSSAANPRSRAAKRATSPSINTDKSLKEAPRVSDVTPVLGATRGGGISKKQKKKHMTRGQRTRLEKGFARAEAVNDQMEKKLDASRSQIKKMVQRRDQWDNINGLAKDETRKVVNDGPDREANDVQWEDVEEAEEVEEGGADMTPADVTESDRTSAESKPATDEHVPDDLDLIT